MFLGLGYFVDYQFLQKLTNLNKIIMAPYCLVLEHELLLFLTKMETLCVHGGKDIKDKVLQHLTNLKSLTIFCDQPGEITDKGLTHLINLTKLELLNWSDNNTEITGEALLTLTNMTTLTVDCIDHLTEDFTKYLTNIKTLNLKGECFIEDDTASRLTTLSPLACVNIDDRNATDDDLFHLVTSSLYQNYLPCDITCDVLKPLFNLTDLKITYEIAIEDDTNYFKRFSHLVGFKQVTNYDLDHGITRSGECLPRLKNLQVVNTVIDCRGWTKLNTNMDLCYDCMTNTNLDKLRTKTVKRLTGNIMTEIVYKLDICVSCYWKRTVKV
jgi:hypothetical protein